jgi:DNA-binding MarR family transcriptional regulator
MTTKSELGRNIAQVLDLNPLMHEYGIVLDLYERGSASSGELRSRSVAGKTAFYAAIKNLVAADLIVAEAGAADARLRQYRLADTARKILDEEFRFLLDWRQPDHSEGPGDGLSAFIRNTKERLKIRFFSCEYQIVLLIYEFEPCTTGDLLARCDVSHSTFFSALRKLSKRGLIVAEAGKGDSRVKQYRLPDGVRQAQNQLRHDLQRWAQEVLAPDAPSCASNSGERGPRLHTGAAC